MRAAWLPGCNIARLRARSAARYKRGPGTSTALFFCLVELALFAAGYLDRNLEGLLLGQDLPPRPPAGIALPKKINARPAVREGHLEAATVATGLVIGDAYAKRADDVALSMFASSKYLFRRL